MASLKFYLNRPKVKTSGIHFLLNYGAFEMKDGKKKYLPFKYYIDESIDTANWGKGKAKASKTFPQYPDFNKKLERIEDKTLTILRKLQDEGIHVNEVTLKSALDKELKAQKDFTPDINTHLTVFADDFIKKSKKKGSTKSQYQPTFDNLKEYEKLYETKLRFLEIDMKFYEKFIDFLIDKEYSPNTIGNRIKNLKVFMNDAFKKRIPVCLDFKLPEFKKPSEETSSVYLTEDELLQLYHLDLKGDSILEKTRDLFLIGAYTGFRFSDFSTLNIENFGKDDVIQKRTIKTDQDVVIPVHPIIQSIIKRNNNEIPKVAYPTFTVAIKDVVKAAKIDYKVSYIETKGGRSEVKIEPKWKLVSSHTARRSFATNAYLAGVPTISIMKMTGHKTESSFMKYIKITLEENAKKLQNHTFFSKVPDAV